MGRAGNAVFQGWGGRRGVIKFGREEVRAVGHVSVQSKRFVLLQERDLRMFGWIAEQKFATKDQIARQFFPNRRAGLSRPDRVCRRRLWELCKFGFLEKRH